LFEKLAFDLRMAANLILDQLVCFVRRATLNEDQFNIRPKIGKAVKNFENISRLVASWDDDGYLT